MSYETHHACHASAPAGHKCSDCTMDREPCPLCYTAWWKARHPNTKQLPDYGEEVEQLRNALAAMYHWQANKVDELMTEGLGDEVRRLLGEAMTDAILYGTPRPQVSGIRDVE